MESLYLLILLFFIVLLIFPISFSLRANYNMITNHGVLCLKVWKIKIVIAKFTIQEGKLILRVNNKKKIEKEVEINEPVFRFITFFQDEIKNKIKFKEVKSVSKIGLSKADLSAYASAVCSDIILIFYSRLKMKNPTCTFSHQCLTDFNDFSMFFSLSSKFSFSVQDIIYSFLASFLRTKGDFKNERI